MTQNIAHFFNLTDSFFQVVRRKGRAPILLVEGPVLLICVSLWRGCQPNEMNQNSPNTGRYQSCMYPRDAVTHFHFRSEGGDMGIFGTTHDHLFKRIPFVVAAHRTLLHHGLSNVFIFDCALGLRSSSSTRSALEGPLRPPSHRPANLRSGNLNIYIYMHKAHRHNLGFRVILKKCKLKILRR